MGSNWLNVALVVLSIALIACPVMLYSFLFKAVGGWRIHLLTLTFIIGTEVIGWFGISVLAQVFCW